MDAENQTHPSQEIKHALADLATSHDAAEEGWWMRRPPLRRSNRLRRLEAVGKSRVRAPPDDLSLDHMTDAPPGATDELVA